MPANAQTFFTLLLQIASFDFFSTEDIVNRALKIKPADPFLPRFAELGFSSAYFINNMGTQVFIFASLFIAFGLAKCLKSLKMLKRRKRSLKDAEQWLHDVITVTLVESYAIIAICSLISFKSLSFTSFGQVVQSVTSVMFFTMGLLVLLSMVHLYRNWETQNSPRYFKTKIYLEELSTTRGPTVLLYPGFFIVRRLLLAVAVVQISDLISIQLFITAMSIIAAVILTGHVKPFEESGKHLFEQANEAFLMVLIYHFVCFTPFLDTRVKTYIGFSFIGLEAFNIAGSLLLVTKVQIQELIRKFKIYRAKQKQRHYTKSFNHAQLKKGIKECRARRAF
jgi:hypothetical protein